MWPRSQSTTVSVGCGMVFNKCTHSSYHNGSTYDHPLPPVASENVCIVIKWNGLTIFKVVILRLRCVFCELLFSLSLFPSLSVLLPTHTVGVIFGFQCTAKNVWICTGQFTRSFLHVIHPTSKLTTSNPTTAQHFVVFSLFFFAYFNCLSVEMAYGLPTWNLHCCLNNNAGSLSYIPNRPIVLYFFLHNRTCFIRCTHMNIMLHWNTHWHQIGRAAQKKKEANKLCTSRTHET